MTRPIIGPANEAGTEARGICWMTAQCGSREIVADVITRHRQNPESKARLYSTPSCRRHLNEAVEQIIAGDPTVVAIRNRIDLWSTEEA